MTNIDKNKANRDALPEQLLANIKDKADQETDKALKKNDVETVQDLLDIRQEVMELRSGNNALQLILAQKDELIEKLTQEKIELKNSLSLNQGEEVVRLEAMNAELKKEYAQALKQIEQLNKKMAEMRNEMQMAPPVETMEDVSEKEAKLLAEVQKLLDQKKKLQQMYDSVNEMNKALRHKAG